MSDVRITLKINGTEKKLKISGSIDERKAIEYFEEIYSELELAKCERSNDTIIEKEEKKNSGTSNKTIARKKETLYSRIIDYIDQNGPVSSKDITDVLQLNKTTVGNYLSKMKKEGKIVNVLGSKQLYCINANNKEGVFEKLIKDERYLDILDYILTRDTFKMEKLRNHVYAYADKIPDVIKPLNNFKLIQWKEEKEEYSVPGTTRVWYCVLKEDAIKYDEIVLRLDSNKVIPNKIMDGFIKDAISKQLIEQNPYGRFNAKLR